MKPRKRYSILRRNVEGRELTNVGAPQLDLKINAEEPEAKTESLRIRHMDRVFVLVLFAMLIVSLVVVFAMGTNVYRSLVSARDFGEQMRLESSFVATSIRTNDEYDAAKSVKGPKGPALVLVETIRGEQYETRLYQYKGKLMQEYAVSGAKFDPKHATSVCSTKRFAFTIKNGLVTVATDAGETRVALRSGRSVA